MPERIWGQRLPTEGSRTSPRSSATWRCSRLENTRKSNPTNTCCKLSDGPILPSRYPASLALFAPLAFPTLRARTHTRTHAHARLFCDTLLHCCLICVTPVPCCSKAARHLNIFPLPPVPNPPSVPLFVTCHASRPRCAVEGADVAGVLASSSVTARHLPSGGADLSQLHGMLRKSSARLQVPGLPSEGRSSCVAQSLWAPTPSIFFLGVLCTGGIC
jgi:hypothetical protein